VINTPDVITFYGASVVELREEMQKSLEVYFEVCEEQGKVPDKPFSGELTIQTSLELYSRIALNAARHQLEIDIYLQEIIEKAVSAEIGNFFILSEQDAKKSATD
jgi:predicted HicB family RNase H-like nuclease